MATPPASDEQTDGPNNGSEAAVQPRVAGRRARGGNLYFPIPYARHCTVAWEEQSDPAGPRYYQINAIVPKLKVDRDFTVDDKSKTCVLTEDGVARVEQRFLRDPALLAVSGPYRFYDWDLWGRLLIRGYDFVVAPATQVLARDVLRMGTVFYGGNFAVRREALARIGGFDTSIAFHGEDTNLGRRLAAIGRVRLAYDCWLHTSARRYKAMGRGAVFRLYIRNFTSEVLRHRPHDDSYIDVRP